MENEHHRSLSSTTRLAHGAMKAPQAPYTDCQMVNKSSLQKKNDYHRLSLMLKVHSCSFVFGQKKLDLLSWAIWLRPVLSDQVTYIIYTYTQHMALTCTHTLYHDNSHSKSEFR